MEKAKFKHCKRRNYPGQAHALTFSCYHNQPFLVNQAICEKLSQSVASACLRYDFALWAYVFMPNHVHLLVWPRKTDYSISLFLQAVKQPIARWVLRYYKDNAADELDRMATNQPNQPYRFWQAGGGYDRNISTIEAAWNEIAYMHQNPIRRRLVENPQDWFYSSYKDWNMQTKGPIAIDRTSFYNGQTRPSGA